MRYLLVLGLVLFLIPATPANAQGPCPFNTSDMVGVYVDPAAPMRVEVFPCGGVSVLWDNPYGRHQAMYVATGNLPGGGLVTRGYRPDPVVGYLDNAYTVGFKPAEAGHIQVITASPYGDLVGIYRLRKYD